MTHFCLSPEIEISFSFKAKAVRAFQTYDSWTSSKAHALLGSTS